MISNRTEIKLGLTALATALLLLNGCQFNTASTYSKPPAPTPQAYKEIPAEFKEGSGWKLAQPGDDKIRPDWWEMYNDPVLTSLEQQVKISNQSIAVAEANYRASQSLVLSARAGLFPTVGASPSYTNARSSATSRGAVVSSGTTTTGTSTTTTSNNGSNGTGSTGSGTTGSTGTSTGSGSSGSTGTGTTGSGTTSGGTGTSTGVTTISTKSISEYSLPFSFSYTIDLWHRVRNQIAANSFAAQASAADIQTALLSVQTTLAQEYFELRQVDAQRLILEGTLKNYQDALKLTGILYKTGIDSEQDVTQAQVQFDTTSAQLTDLGVSRAQYEHAIAVLIGRPASSFEIAYSAFVPNPPEVPVGVPSSLLERRPDIAAMERIIASDNALIGVARAAYYPNLTLSASAGLQTTNFTQWFTWPSRFWSLGPSFAETLFEGGARRAAIDQAEANYDAAVANYRQTVLTSFQAVEDQLSTLRILSQEVSQQQTAVNSSQHYLDLANIRYKTGVESYLNVITAQNTLLTNREAQLSVHLRQMTASVQLILALGGGWDRSQLPANVLPLAPRNKPLPSDKVAPSPASPNINPPPVKAASGL